MIRFSLILSLIPLLICAISESAYSSSPKFNWKVNGAWAPGALETKATDKFIDLVNQRSKGQIKLTSFPAKQLGDSLAALEMLGTGTLELNVDTVSWYYEIARANEWLILAFPYVIKDANHWKRIQANPWFIDLKKGLYQKNGIKVLADNGYRLPRHLIHKSKGLSSPRDIMGVKLRMASGKMWVKPWKDFGADVMVVPWGESAMALQTGMVEAMEAPAQTIYPMKFYEGGRHITLTGHQMDTANIMISKIHWEKLTPELQEIMVSSAKEAMDWFSDQILSVWEEHKKLLAKAGVTFHEADGEAWRKKALEIANKWEQEGEWPKGLFKKIQEM